MTPEERDAANPLRGFKSRFVSNDPDLIYLDGNSLGRQPVAAKELADDLMRRQWADRLIRGWGEEWMALPSRIGDKLGQLLGARPGEVLVADSTSVNLHKLASAALAARPGRTRVVTDSLNFPSDVHVLGALAGANDRTLEIHPSADGIHGPEAALIESLDTNVALVSLSATAFRTGFNYDVEAVTSAAHAVGALTLWDLSHTVGSVPVDLTGWGVDLAVGCTYKYVNGGPGSPAFLYVRSELADELTNPIAGWMGHAEAFSFDLAHVPASGTRRFLTGTPPVLSTALIEPGVDLLLEAGMPTLRRVSLDLTGYLLELFDEHLESRGFGLASPRDERRGSHIIISHPDALAIDLAMIGEANVIPDFRPPDGIRLGIAPLYVGFVDVREAVRRLCRVVDERLHEQYMETGVSVT